MSGNKGCKEGQKDFNIDFDAFDGQLDDEIDRLFMPIDGSSPGGEKTLAFDVGEHGLSPGLAEQNPVVSPATGANSVGEHTTVSYNELKVKDPETQAPEPGLSQFHELLDNEVDRLFVPSPDEITVQEGLLVQNPADPGKEATSESEQVTVSHRELPMNEPKDQATEPALSEFHELLDSEVDRLFVPFSDSPDSQASLSDQKTVDSKVDTIPAQDTSTISLNELPLDKADKAALEPGLSQFQVLLDSEVDKLFVPFSDAASTAEGKSSAGIEKPAFLEGPSTASPLFASAGDLPSDAPAGGTPVAETQEVKVAEQPAIQPDFELKLDSEIDRLFVPVESTPAMAKMDEITQPRGVMGPTESITISSHTENEPVLSTAGQKEEVRIGGKGVEKSPAAEVAPSKKMQVANESLDEHRVVTGLVESFSVAYLSLDWEFSLENISRMNQVLKKLDPYSAKRAETKSLSKMVKAVLHFLKNKPQSASPQMIEFLREAQDLLKALLLVNRPVNRLEKEQLRNLVSRFRSLGSKASSEKKAESVKTSDRLEAAEKPSYGGTIKTPAGQISMRMGLGANEQSLVGFKKWMESFCYELQETIKGIEAENKRLLHVEKASRKSISLAPLTARLNSIRSALERHASAIRKQEQGLLVNLAQIQDLKTAFQAKAGDPPRPLAPSSAVPVVVPEETRHIDRVAEEKVVKGAEHSRQELVCLFDMAGKRLAVEGKHVLKTGRLSEKRAMKITKRGHATLKDFKPLFRNLKTGLLGKWKELPEAELKAYQFLPLSPDFFDFASPGPILPLDGAILLSNGRYHALLFANFSGIALQNESMTVEPGDKDVIGIIHPESKNPIQVLNVDQMFNELSQGNFEQPRSDS